MLKTRTKIIVMALLLAFLQGQSKASIEFNWTDGDYNIPYPGWPGGADVLNTHNYVTVTMFNGGGLIQFNMYDSSKLTMYGGDIGELNLYPNSTATLRGGAVFELWVDPASTGWAKLYATVEYIDPIPDSQGYISVIGYWLADDMPFNIALRDGEETITHIQFIPEPATLVFLGLGGLNILRRRRSCISGRGRVKSATDVGDNSVEGQNKKTAQPDC